jgi:hypothetical protein
MNRLIGFLKLIPILAVFYITIPFLSGINNIEWLLPYAIFVLTISGVASFMLSGKLMRAVGFKKKEKKAHWQYYAAFIIWFPLFACIYHLDKSVVWTSECGTHKILEVDKEVQPLRYGRSFFRYYIRTKAEDGVKKYYSPEEEWLLYKKGDEINLCKHRRLMGFLHLEKAE